MLKEPSVRVAPLPALLRAAIWGPTSVPQDVPPAQPMLALALTRMVLLQPLPHTLGSCGKGKDKDKEQESRRVPHAGQVTDPSWLRQGHEPSASKLHRVLLLLHLAAS